MDWFELSEKEFGLAWEGRRAWSSLDASTFAPPYDDAVRILQKKGGSKEDVLKKISEKYIQNAKHSVGHLNGLGEEKTIDDAFIKSFQAYQLAKRLSKVASALEKNEDIDLLPVHGQLTSLVSGQSTGLAPAKNINYKNYKPFMKCGYAPIDNILGGIPSDGPIIAYGIQGVGKCLAKGTKVLMFDGTTKAVEEVQIGDLLMGVDSYPREVLALGHGYDEMYEIIPTKGDSYIVNSSHILSLRLSNRTNGIKKDNKFYGYKTGDIINISIENYLASSKAFKQYAMGWRVGVYFDGTSVPLDPYFLGLWLGDGDSNRPSITNVDKEVIDYIYSFAKSNELNVSIYGNDSYMLARKHASGRENIITKVLRDYNLINNKHIPQVYKSNSVEVRSELLAGILDTDGSYVKHANCYDYVSKSETLARDVAFIARSLGLAAYVSKCKKTCTNNGVVGEYFRVSISGDVDRLPLRITRKQAHPRNQKKRVTNTHIEVRPIGKGEYFGFTLDGDGLFLLEDFTVTHNSHFSEILSLGQLTEYKDKNVGIYTLEMSAEHYLWRAVKMYKDLEKYLDRLFVSGSIRSVNDLVSEVQTKRLDFIVIDDMDRIAGGTNPEAYQQAYLRIADICRFLKIPVLILAQPNREAKLAIQRGERFLSPYDISWSSGAENAAALLIGLQRANALDMITKDSRGAPIDPMFPVEDDDREYLIFWKSRDGWPGDYSLKGQLGPGAIRLEKRSKNDKIWMGEPYGNRLWQPNYRPKKEVNRK